MNNSQKAAVQKIRVWLNSQMSAHSVESYGECITKFDAKERDNGFVSVSATTELVNLPEGNLLRALDYKSWLFFLGDRGAITLVSGDKSLAAFAGKKFMGINIAKDYRG